MSDRTVREMMAEHSSTRFEGRVNSIAHSLRTMADNIESQKARPRFGSDTLVDHSATAEDVLHIIVWGVANLGMEHLISEATDADRLLRGTDG